MSSDAVAEVFRCSPAKDKAFAVHLAIADSVNDQNENEFWMSIRRLALKARVSRATAQRAIAWLIEHDLIELADETVEADPWKSGKPVRYRFVFPDLPVIYETRRSRVTRDRVSHGEAPGSRTVSDPPAVAPSSSKTQEEPKDDEPTRLANLLADLIAANGSKRPNVTKTWIVEIDRLIRLDGRSPQQVENMIRWCQAHSFWRAVILSAKNLRAKYDTMRLQATAGPASRPANVTNFDNSQERRSRPGGRVDFKPGRAS